MKNKVGQSFWNGQLLSLFLVVLVIVAIAAGVFIFKDGILSWVKNLPDYSAGEEEHKLVDGHTSATESDFGNEFGISLKEDEDKYWIQYKNSQTHFYITPSSGSSSKSSEYTIFIESLGFDKETHLVDYDGSIDYKDGSAITLDSNKFLSFEITLNEYLPLFKFDDERKRLVWIGDKDVNPNLFVIQEIDEETGKVLSETEVTTDFIQSIYGTTPKGNFGDFTITLNGIKTIFYLKKTKSETYKIKREPLNNLEKMLGVVLWDLSYGEIDNEGIITLKKNSKKTNIEDLEKYSFDFETKLFSKIKNE